MSAIESALKVADSASPNSTLGILAKAYRNAVGRAEKFVYAIEKAEGERDALRKELAALKAEIARLRVEAFFKGHQNARRWNAEDTAALIREDNSRKPEAGDLVVSASSQTVQWNGLPDPWYWTEGDAEAMKDERIVVLMRRTEIERRIGEARHGEQA